MKYAVTLTRADGKTVLLAANEYIDIDIKQGNHYIARLTVRDDDQGTGVYDSADRLIPMPELNK